MIYQIKELKYDARGNGLCESEVTSLTEPDLISTPLGIMTEAKADELINKTIRPGDSVVYLYPKRTTRMSYFEFKESMREIRLLGW